MCLLHFVTFAMLSFDVMLSGSGGMILIPVNKKTYWSSMPVRIWFSVSALSTSSDVRFTEKKTAKYCQDSNFSMLLERVSQAHKDHTAKRQDLAASELSTSIPICVWCYSSPNLGAWSAALLQHASGCLTLIEKCLGLLYLYRHGL